MRRKYVLYLVFGSLLLMPQVANAISVAGSDWLFNTVATLNTALGNYDATQANLPIAIGQTSATDITIPLTLPDPVNLTLTASGSLSGPSYTHINATAHLDDTGPITIDEPGTFSGTIKLTDVNAVLDGEINGVNPLDTTGDYGARGYYIEGNPSPTSTVTAHAWLFIGSYPIGFWSDVGNASLQMTSWNAVRGEGLVPEPGTLAMFLGLAISLGGYCCWRRRGSR